nr:transposase [Fontibacillus phaseoli]
MIDVTIVRVHQHGAGAKGGPSASYWPITRRLNDQNPRRCRCFGQPAVFCADRAYDTHQILHLLKEQSATSVITSEKNRREQRERDKEIYKERHLIECLFNKVKHYRRLATRYDKLARTFMAFLALASIMVWLA